VGRARKLASVSDAHSNLICTVNAVVVGSSPAAAPNFPDPNSNLRTIDC